MENNGFIPIFNRNKKYLIYLILPYLVLNFEWKTIFIERTLGQNL